ncbi:MAG: hypothetical protein A2156_04810 [Deltaproteobacteria bacterium RBG_16_48_10]|nr:MAG: hypothetical protein A2156_04810 [Deltaproteobacteria bacterium RBG_16_48_10]
MTESTQKDRNRWNRLEQIETDIHSIFQLDTENQTKIKGLEKLPQNNYESVALPLSYAGFPLIDPDKGWIYSYHFFR